jgi:GNAT superfamily N-acetyltransferase
MQIKEGHRGTGGGSLLVKTLEEYLLQETAASVLFLTTIDTLHKARGFYEARGFEWDESKTVPLHKDERIKELEVYYWKKLKR